MNFGYYRVAIDRKTLDNDNDNDNDNTDRAVAVPANYTYDILVRSMHFTSLSMVGAAVVFASFALFCFCGLCCFSFPPAVSTLTSPCFL